MRLRIGCMMTMSLCSILGVDMMSGYPMAHLEDLSVLFNEPLRKGAPYQAGDKQRR